MPALQSLATFFSWRERGLGRLEVCCPKCGHLHELRLLDDILDATCPGCGAQLARERLSRLLSGADAESGLQIAVSSGVLTGDEASRVRAESSAAGITLAEATLRLGLLEHALHLAFEDSTDGIRYVARPLETLLSGDLVERALALRSACGGRLGEILVMLLREDEKERLLSFAIDRGLEPVRPDTLDIPESVLALVPAAVAQEILGIPLSLDRDRLRVALEDPLDFERLDRLRLLVGHEIDAVLAEPEGLFRALDRFYLQADGLPDALSESEAEEVRLLAEASIGLETPLPEGAEPDEAAWQPERREVRALDMLLLDLCDNDAMRADIHPSRDGYRIHVRYPGNRTGTTLAGREVGLAILQRLRVQSGVLEGQGRGSFTYALAGESNEVTVTHLPSRGGDAAVLEIGPALLPILALESLGVEEEESARFASLLTGSGLTVIASPPRGGKSTTLRAILAALGPEADALAISPPHSPQITGVPVVHPDQAPLIQDISCRQLHDIVVIDGGLTRPLLALALQVAATGARAILALAASTAEEATRQILALGTPRDLLEALLDRVAIQHLVHRTCPTCRWAYRPSARGLEALGILEPPSDLRQASLHVGIGCWSCGSTGHAGKAAILDVVPAADAMTRALTPAPHSVPDMLARALKHAVAGRIAITEITEISRRRAVSPAPCG